MVLLDAVAPAKSVSNSALIFTAHMRVQPGTTPFPWFPPADCDHCSKRLWPNATNVGPRNIPITPNASAPPNTPSITRIIGVEPPRLMSSGLTTLSNIPTISPHAIMKTAHAVEPCRYSQKAAGAATIGGPPGTKDSTKVINPRDTEPGTPAIAKPIAATTPCSSAVPSTP